jgi:hypothetical protein
MGAGHEEKLGAKSQVRQGRRDTIRSNTAPEPEGATAGIDAGSFPTGVDQCFTEKNRRILNRDLVTIFHLAAAPKTPSGAVQCQPL